MLRSCPDPGTAADEPERLQLPANGVIPWAQVIEGCDLGLEGSQFLPSYPGCAVSTYTVSFFSIGAFVRINPCSSME